MAQDRGADADPLGEPTLRAPAVDLDLPGAVERGRIALRLGEGELVVGAEVRDAESVAEELGLTIKDVQERIGNSKLGNANPSGGSTTAPSLSPSVKDAAIKARMLMAERVAPLLGNPKPEEVVFADGKVSAKSQSLSWQQAAAALPAGGITSHGVWRSDLQARGVHGVCFAEVEVDIETGHVKPIKMVHKMPIPTSLAKQGSQFSSKRFMSPQVDGHRACICRPHWGVPCKAERRVHLAIPVPHLGRGPRLQLPPAHRQVALLREARQEEEQDVPAVRAEDRSGRQRASRFEIQRGSEQDLHLGRTDRSGGGAQSADPSRLGARACASGSFGNCPQRALPDAGGCSTVGNRSI